ncbi:DUF1403 family protein [Tardiphaga sp. 619_E2_N8_5]|uniref:DUF1403 family protein n=1 Tax=unclassified Tardiphaga TaxID=2631404 RepID=UPI003F22C757
MSSRVRMIPASPRRFPPMPGWARLRDVPGGADDAPFVAGAALAALHPIARDEHLLGALWRQRLALTCAARLAGQGGRSEDEAMLRDHWYLRQSSDDPGPAGRLLDAWRRLGTGKALTLKETWPTMLPALLACRDDEALQEGIACALAQCIGGGNPVQAAAATAAMSLRLRPDCRPLALWLADAVLAHHLSWPAPVPLLAAHLTGNGLRRATIDGDDQGWMQVCSLAYARAAAAAWDRYAELGHRADRLLGAAPKLRGKDADTMVATLLSEDAQPARGGQTASDRSSRRLFERLVSLGVVRELTGRPTFRLYGL